MGCEAESQTPPSAGSGAAHDSCRGQRRRAAVAWTSGALSIILLAVEYRLRALHPASLLFLLLLIVTIAPAFGAMAVALWQLARGRHHNVHARWTLAAILPAVGWAIWGAYGIHEMRIRENPRNLAMRLLNVAGASVMEARALYLFPHRLETPRLIMFYGAGIPDAQADAAEMDQHVARMEELTGLRLRTKIFLIRSGIFGQRHVAFEGLAFGSAEGRAGYVDRHELAHAVMAQHEQVDSDPPTMLVEGWAESQSRRSQDLAHQALSVRALIRDCADRLSKMTDEQRQTMRWSLVDADGFERLVRIAAAHGGKVPSYLRELTDPFWYHHDNGPVYSIGGAFCDFVIRTFGAGRFVQLYFASRPGHFEQECRRVFGRNLDSLERQFWAREERLAYNVPPAR